MKPVLPRRSDLTERRLGFRDVMRRSMRFSVPAFLSSLLVFGMNLINYLYLAGFQSIEPIASYGIVSAYTTLAAGFFIPIATGTAFVLERAQKANDPYKEWNVITTSMLSAVLFGIFAIVFAHLIAPGYIWQVVTPEAIKEPTTVFLRYFSLTFLPILYFSVTTNILIQCGEHTAPVLAEVSALALHGSFSYIFVGLFDWDLRGIAISAVIAQTSAGLINTHMVLQQRRKTGVRSPIRIDFGILKELLREERANVLIAVLGGVFAIFLQFFIDELGIATIAGFTLFFLFQDALFIPIHALRAPARRMSAEAIESGGNNALQQIVNPLIVLAVLYSVALIPVTRLIGPPLFMLFSHDPGTTIVGMRILNLLIYYYSFYAISTILSASLEGLGKKNLVMGLNIGFNYLVRFLVLILTALIIQGDQSIAICFPCSWALSAAAFIIYFFATYPRTGKRNYSL